MTSHLTHEQLESFWAGTAAQVDITHIRSCDVCRARLAEVIHEEEMVQIGELYLMRKRRMSDNTEVDSPIFGGFIKFVSQPS